MSDGGGWTHPVCAPCYDELEPGREPFRLVAAERELQACCRCGMPTVSGIYYRADPAGMTYCFANDHG